MSTLEPSPYAARLLPYFGYRLPHPGKCEFGSGYLFRRIPCLAQCFDRISRAYMDSFGIPEKRISLPFQLCNPAHRTREIPVFIPDLKVLRVAAGFEGAVGFTEFRDLTDVIQFLLF